MSSRNNHSFDPELLGAPVTRQEKQEGYTIDVLDPPQPSSGAAAPTQTSSSSRERLAQPGSNGQPSSQDQAQPSSSADDREKAPGPPDTPQHRLVWYRRTRNQLWIGLATFVVIAAIVGGVVGGVVGGRNSGSDDSNQTSTTSATSSTTTAVDPGVQGPTSTTGGGGGTGTATLNPGQRTGTAALTTPTIAAPNPGGRRRRS